MDEAATASTIPREVSYLIASSVGASGGKEHEGEEEGKNKDDLQKQQESTKHVYSARWNDRCTRDLIFPSEEETLKGGVKLIHKAAGKQ